MSNGIKFGFKVKIVDDYEKLFDPKFNNIVRGDDKDAFDFWNEFFLLKVSLIRTKTRSSMIFNQLKNCSLNESGESIGT